MPWFDIIFLGIIGLLEISLGIFFLTRYVRSAATLSFGLMSISIALWVWSNGLTLVLNTSGELFDLLSRSAWIWSILIFNFLYLFILNYPFASERVGVRFLTWLFLPTFLFACLIYFSNSLVVGFVPDPYGNSIYGNDYWLFFIFLVFLFILSLVEGLVKLRMLDGLHRRNMSILLWAILFSGLIGITNHLVIPYLLGNPVVTWIGPGASVIWLGMVGWVLTRK